RALHMAIATCSVGKRRILFSFYMFVLICLVGLFLIDRLDYFHIALIDPTTGKPSGELSRTSWFTGLHPFLALGTIFFDKWHGYNPPSPSMLPEGLRSWPIGWYLASPVSFYIGFMFFLSAVLVTPSILLLRRMAQSTTSLKTLILQRLKISKGDRTRKPRGVWNNPIAWREAKTKVSAARASILRYGFIAAGLIGAFVLVVMFSREAENIPQYIPANSYNSGDGTLGTLYIASTNNTGGNFGVLANLTQVTLNGNAVPLSTL